MRNIEAAAHTLANIPAKSQTDRQTNGQTDEWTNQRDDSSTDKSIICKA